MNDDITFFTNEPGATLLDRFKKTLKFVKYFAMSFIIQQGAINTSQLFQRFIKPNITPREIKGIMVIIYIFTPDCRHIILTKNFIWFNKYT